MRRGGQLTLFVLLGGLSVGAAASAVNPVPSASPYDGIVDRNVFGLKPPPPPPDPEATKTPPAKITLTGIIGGTILGNKRALMKTPAPQGKPGEQPKGEQSYILTIGQREGDIEVLDIDEKAGSVKVNNAGAVLTLTFEKDGAKLPATPPPPVPGAPPGAPVPGAIPAVPNPAVPQPANPGFSLPTRAIRTVPSPGVVNPAGGNYGAGLAPTMGTPVANYGATPALPTYSTAQSQAQVAQAQQPQVNPEQQMLMMELQREANKSNPKFPPLPPTALTPPGQAQTPTLPPRLQ